MKERPILFSAPMIRTILDGSKTQTRRMVKPDISGRVMIGGRNWHLDDSNSIQASPYGVPGERLWVRETFGRPWHHSQQPYFYRATDGDTVGWHPDFDGWKSSIHMPRAASRIDLLIKAVRVERLQNISEQDCLAEGITYAQLPDNQQDAQRARTWYRGLWEQINGDNGDKSWEANPWVWVIEFERVKP